MTNKTKKNSMKMSKLGMVTLVLSLSFIFLGLPSQIIQIWNTHSVNNVSVFAFILLAVQSTFWVAYGIQRKDWPVKISNFFAVIFAGIIIVEWFMFH